MVGNPLKQFTLACFLLLGNYDLTYGRALGASLNVDGQGVSLDGAVAIGNNLISSSASICDFDPGMVLKQNNTKVYEEWIRKFLKLAQNGICEDKIGRVLEKDTTVVRVGGSVDLKVRIPDDVASDEIKALMECLGAEATEICSSTSTIRPRKGKKPGKKHPGRKGHPDDKDSDDDDEVADGTAPGKGKKPGKKHPGRKGHPDDKDSDDDDEITDGKAPRKEGKASKDATGQVRKTW